ncbi:hypothetical protein KKE60_06660 [Patescibacteria group bacterium]|nr:hypothetical protein [Patescibacteria group bacterium]
MEYHDFLAQKKTISEMSGFEPTMEINPMLFTWQADIVRWALRKGKAALWEDCGLGKTPQQLEWAKHVHAHTGEPVLILAPLAVSQQTIREGTKFGVEVHKCKDQSDVVNGINITNYERLHLFDAVVFSGVVLDESSILKSFMGKTKQAIIDSFRNTNYKLACTATPAPNDHMELGNHADFLDVMPSNEMLSRWFINDTMNFGTYRLKGHAVNSFWEWVSSWAVCIGKPSDMGADDDGFNLPDMEIIHHVIPTDHAKEAGEGNLFYMPAVNATGLHKELRKSSSSRAKISADMVNGSDESWIVWLNTNYDADEILRLIPDAVEVRGNTPDAQKEQRLIDFSTGNSRVIITKPSIAGFGLNWQHCHNVVFMGLTYSYEQLYQAIRRSFRFGQKEKVNIHLVSSETEQVVVDCLQQKQVEHEKMKSNMYRFNFSKLDQERKKLVVRETVREEKGVNWKIINGDSVERIKTIESDSVGLSVFSPPFSNLYIYSDSIRDMGNCKNDQEFFDQFKFLIPDLLRITIPGRLACIHCKDLVDYKSRDGHAGLRDFPGDIIRAMTDSGWVYHSRVTIWKCPVTEMTRTKAQGLLYKQIKKDSAYCRTGLSEYLLAFRKQGDDVSPIVHDKRNFPLEQWQRIAEPVWPDKSFVESGIWFNIAQTKCLNKEMAKDHNDEKHICPLQIGVIENCLKLWSNPGDLIFDPFSGIGSTGYVAVKSKRNFLGVELKQSYFDQAIRYLKRAEQEGVTMPLFDLLETGS